MDLKADCIAWDCQREFEDAMWAARAIDAREPDMRYLVGRFVQACASIAHRTAHTRNQVEETIRYLVSIENERVAS